MWTIVLDEGIRKSEYLNLLRSGFRLLLYNDV